MAGSTPIYGFPYPQSTDLVADYPTLGQELAEDVETVISGLGSGLNKMTPTSIANSGGTASATAGAVTFTGVNSISLNGVFTSTYANYRIVMNYKASTTASLYARWRTSGTDVTATNYYSVNLNAQSSAGALYTSGTGYLFADYADTYLQPYSMDAFSPQIAGNTTSSTSLGFRSVGPLVQVNGSTYNVAGSHDGITFYPSTGTITGVIRVYGYQN